MKNIFILFVLISLSLFTSCDKREMNDDFALSSQDDIYDRSEVNFTINNEDNTLFEQDALLLSNNSVHAKTYHWDFGNGDTSSEAQPNYEYKIHGYYTVTLTISDINGNTQNTSHEVLVLCLFGGGNHDF